MDWLVQLTEIAAKGSVLAWHCHYTWKFLHKLIQSTIAIFVQCSRICPLVRLLSHLNNMKRIDWEVCVTAIAMRHLRARVLPSGHSTIHRELKKTNYFTSLN